LPAAELPEENPEETRGEEHDEQEEKSNYKGRPPRSRNIIAKELGIILDVIEEHLLAGADMWRKVPIEAFSRKEGKFPFRDWDSIHNKFKRIRPKRMVTESTVFKAVERRAMTIQVKISENFEDDIVDDKRNLSMPFLSIEVLAGLGSTVNKELIDSGVYLWLVL
jgi:hypothetical protein